MYNLHPNVTQAQIEKQLPAFVEKYMGNDMSKYGFQLVFVINPFKDVYFDNTALDNVKHGDKTVVYIFLSVAILISIDCLYQLHESINHSGSRAFKRSGLAQSIGCVTQ